MPTSPLNQERRLFLKQSAALSALAVGGSIVSTNLVQAQPPTNLKTINPIGYAGQRRDPVTGCYHLGQGYRMYNPRLIRFNAADSMSPFGKGGINSYAYCLGDPINKKDPSGHFAILSLLIGSIVGAVVGATISAAAEGIKSAITGESFDWKQVAIGTALGFISGGFGAAAIGVKTSTKVGLAVADTVVSGAVDFGLNVAAGTAVKDAGINAGFGGVIGLGTFGLGQGVSKVGTIAKQASKKVQRVNGRIGIPLSPTGDDIKAATNTLKIGDVTSAAQYTFDKLGGKSEAIAKYYDSLPSEFFNQPVNMTTVAQLVKGENAAAINNKNMKGFRNLSTPDKAAYLATPFRGFAADLIAEHAVVGSGQVIRQMWTNDYALKHIFEFNNPFN